MYGIFTYSLVDFYGFHVGKYTYPSHRWVLGHINLWPPGWSICPDFGVSWVVGKPHLGLMAMAFFKRRIRPDELGEGWFFVGIDFFGGRSTFEASGGGPGGMTGMIYFHFWQLMHFDRLLMHANWDGKRIVICGIFTSTAAGVCLDGIVAC